MKTNDSAISGFIDAYFSSLIEQHGAQAAGVGWNGDASLITRFEQLAKIITQGPDEAFSITDLGCGYGALLPFLHGRFRSFTYVGCDISPAMIESAKKTHHAATNAEFFVADAPVRETDYVIASGIFNLKGEFDYETWGAHIRKILDTMHACSKKGFSFNILTQYSDEDKMRDDLYYADPCELFDLCKRKYSRNVALLHDYELYDFTVLVRKLP
jgi:Trans-aconitate methyltransferase